MSLSLKEMKRILELEIKETGSIKEAFKKCNAMWTYQGRKGEPHALLAGGNHSDGYFNVSMVTQFPNLCKSCTLDILPELVIAGVNNIDAVVSSSYAALPFGKAVADMLRAVFVFTEKQDKKQVWTGRFELPEGAIVLQAEELITTMGTTENVRQAVIKDNPNSVKFAEVDDKIAVATIVHRPAKLPIEYPNYKVIASMEIEVHNWEEGKCPLCEKGSVALKPKPNWDKFS